jgi:hypothetical protein
LRFDHRVDHDDDDGFEQHATCRHCGHRFILVWS